MHREPDLEDALRIARVLMDTTGMDAATAAFNSAIPDTLREEVVARLEMERVIRIRDPHMVEDPNRPHQEWLHLVDRAAWFYWPRLRQYLIDRKGWSDNVVRSLDRTTDRVLAAMEDARGEGSFRTQGLIVGYVQSGKTANYSALIAKASDCGYRLIIVLTGVHNSLRQQTQRRLTAELVGLDDGRSVGVGTPDSEHQWYTFTSSALNGDFNPGHANTAALTGTNPVLIVAKKWVSVLRSMNDWFDRAPEDILVRVPTLIIDDEADQASVNTGGDRPPDAQDEDGAEAVAEETAPSRTNALIRSLVQRFDRVAYVAYTATPFANILIDHTAVDRVAGEDLYPRSFIVDLPKPPGYWGAERIFGLPDGEAAEGADGAASPDGLDVLRRVPDEHVPMLVPARRVDVSGFEPELPESLVEALDAFVLAGAARIQRGDGDVPATMLIHTSYRTVIQRRLTELVDTEVDRLRDQWRYLRDQGIEERLRRLWERDFRPVIRALDQRRDNSFEALAERAVGVFFEQLQVRQINSGSLDELDYEREPDLKVVIVGGTRLSRGLTLEGLLISYYVRPANNYDTLMQMGRWFGFREGYADLTRIYTTELLEQWFRDLAMVELEVREDINRYEQERLTPLQFGIRIRAHPAMMVTSPLKMQNAQVIDLSFNSKLRQTINFPFANTEWLRQNIITTGGFLSSLGPPTRMWREGQPMWDAVPWQSVVDFLGAYLMDESATQVRAEPMRRYIERQVAHGELVEWVVAVMGQRRREERLGEPMDLGIVGADGRAVLVNPIERTRVRNTSTLKTITSPSDQEVGLTREQLDEAGLLPGRTGENLRYVRDERQGALLVYPISRFSGHGRSPPATDESSDRVPIYEDPRAGEDIVGVALVFPASESAAAREYVTGTVGTGEE
jgi:Z1 domain-containing protein